ncbi:MAG TPA: ferritin-like domain-containing protein [Firmicutes bacterium]|nr:ferritin-like domain-containing protein [Candidatus Fermentithermobacillaceae bacterium]
MNEYYQRLQAAYIDELEAYTFYSYLASVAPSMELSQILTSIARDEYGHARTIAAMLVGVPGMTLPTWGGSPAGTITWEEALSRAIDGELGDTAEYAELARIAPTTDQRLLLMTLLGDEFGHARTFSAILSNTRR